MVARKRDRGIAILICAIGLLPIQAFAQRGQTASLDGVVRDGTDAVVPGARLTASSPQLIGGPQQTQTDAEGRYWFTALLPGVYEVTVTRDGFKTLRRSGIELPPGLGITVDLQLDVAPVAEVVNIDARAPAIDVRSSASPTLIGKQLLENLPIGHDFQVFSYIGLTPGITTGSTFGVPGFVIPFSVDGTDGTGPEYGQPRAKPNGNWIDEIQIVSLGANAQYGEYGTARANAITRSGSNRFAGLGEYWLTRPGWTGNNRGSLPSNLAERFRPIDVLERWDANVQVGGPVIRDRLWFFSGLEYYKNAERSFSFASLPRTQDEPRVLTREPKVLVKLTGAPASGLRLEGYVEYDSRKSINENASPLVRPEALSTSEAPERMGNARLTWTLGDRTLFEAHYGMLWEHGTYGPTPPSSTSGPPGHYDRLTGVQSVNTTSFGDIWSRVTSATATLTRYAGRLAGRSHEFKAGIDYQRDNHREVYGRPGGMVFYDHDGAPDTVSIGPGPTFRPLFWRTSVFGQDTWQLGDRLTIEPGLRVAFYDTSVPAQDVTFFESRTVSPRLGVAWDVSADHRTVVRAHYGHYQHPVVGNFFDFLDPGAQVTTIIAKVVGPDHFEEITRNTNYGGANDRIDPNAKHSYVEEYLAGIERELWSGLSVKAQYVRRNFRDPLGFVDIGSTWTPVAAIDPGPDGRSGSADDGLPMTVYYNYNPQNVRRMFTNPPDAFGRYSAVQLIGTKRHSSDWELQTSYTWSRARSNYNNSSPSTDDLFTVGNWANPNRMLFSAGRTDRDYPHEVKVLGTHMVPYWGGVRVSGIYRYQSGAPWARTAFFGPLTQWGAIRVEPTGSRKLPAVNSADVRVEKTFRTGAATTGVYADVFNINNQGIANFVNTGSGPNLGIPIGWSSPRTLRMGLRVTF